MCMDVRYFYLNNHMGLSKYIMIHTSMIPEEFITDYNLKVKLHNVYNFKSATKYMYELLQSVSISDYALVLNLAPH